MTAPSRPTAGAQALQSTKGSKGWQDRAERRLGGGDRGRAAVGRGERELAPHRTDEPVAGPVRQQPKRPPERGAGDAVKRLLLVGVAAGGTAEAWVVQRQRSPNHGHPPRQLTLDLDG